MYSTLNRTELSELVRKKTGRRLNLERDKMIALLEEGSKEEKSAIERSRLKLQVFVEKNWVAIQTNLPCFNEKTAGKCTVHFCSDFTHMNCLLGAKELMDAKS